MRFLLVALLTALLAAASAEAQPSVYVRPGVAHDFHEECIFGLRASYPYAGLVETWNGRVVPLTSVSDYQTGAKFHYDLTMPWGGWHAVLIYDFGGQTLHNSKRAGSQIVRFDRRCR